MRQADDNRQDIGRSYRQTAATTPTAHLTAATLIGVNRTAYAQANLFEKGTEAVSWQNGCHKELA